MKQRLKKEGRNCRKEESNPEIRKPQGEAHYQLTPHAVFSFDIH